LLIDICLKSHVNPRIDYACKELTLCGDYHLIVQCFFNLREGKQIYQFSYVLTENGEKSDEKEFNPYISLKINQASAVEESYVCYQ
jgi:hypothetical protein